MERHQTVVEGVGQVDTQEFLSVAIQDYGVPVAKLTITEKTRPTPEGPEEKKTTVFDITKSTVTIGRKDADDGVDITVNHKVMSSRHLYLFIEKNGAVKLRDLNSRNKTFIRQIEADGVTVSVQKECFPGRDYKVDPTADKIEIGAYGNVSMSVQLLGDPEALGRAATGGSAVAVDNLGETQIIPIGDDDDNIPPPPAADSFQRRKASSTELAAPAVAGGRGSATLASFMASPNLGAAAGFGSSSASFNQPTPGGQLFGGSTSLGESTTIEKSSAGKKVDFDVDATQDYGYSPVSGALPGGGPNALPATLMASSSDELLLEPSGVVGSTTTHGGAVNSTSATTGGEQRSSDSAARALSGGADPDATLTVQGNPFGDDAALGPTIIAPTLELPEKAPPPQRRSAASPPKVKDSLSEDSEEDEVPPPLSNHSSRNALAATRTATDRSSSSATKPKAAAPLPRDEEVTHKFPVPPVINLVANDGTEDDEPPSPTLAPVLGGVDERGGERERQKSEGSPLGLLRSGTIAGKSTSSLKLGDTTSEKKRDDPSAAVEGELGEKRSRKPTSVDVQEDEELRPKAPSLRKRESETGLLEGDEVPEPAVAMPCTDGLRKPAAVSTSTRGGSKKKEEVQAEEVADAPDPSPTKRAPPAKKAPTAKASSQSSEWSSDDEETKKKKAARAPPVEAKKSAEPAKSEEKEETETKKKKPSGKRAPVAEDKGKEDDGSSSDDDKAPPVWQFKHDLRKKASRPEAWTDYNAADSAIIEAGFVKFQGTKSRAKKIRECKISATYSVDYTEMIQFRNDDRDRQRDIQRKP